MSKKYFLLALLPFFFACDYIEEEDRLIEVEIPGIDPTDETVIAKNILIEDFTGQRCVNCPKGTKVIEELMNDENFGDRIIAVGIHSGPFGKSVAGNLLPLATQTGCDYYDYWKVEQQPGALINRRNPVIYSVTEWTSAVSKELTATADLNLQVKPILENNQLAIQVSAEAVAPVNGRVQVWVLEDNIVGVQTIPNAPDEDPEWTGGNKRDYVHNHVFRTAVNQPMGDEFVMVDGEQKGLVFTQPLDESWNPEHLSVVVIVYNDGGVVQVAKGHVE